MIADYHVHTTYCGHAKGKTLDYVNAAIEAGISEIGFSDHLGRYYLTKSQRKRYWDWGMDERNLARYVAELLELRDIYSGRIEIKIGLEVDYVEGAEELVAPLVQNFPIDFLLGSIHCLPVLGWQHLTGLATVADSSLIYKEFFRLARAAVESGLFSSLSHPDFVWRYVDWPKNTDLPFEEISSLVRTAAASKHCIEINTNAYEWSRSKELPRDPFDFLIGELHSAGVPISLGSDAHDPRMVAMFFPEVIALLKHKGIDSFCRFSDRNSTRETLG